MKFLLAILLPVAYIWASSYVGGEVMPDDWFPGDKNQQWWSVPAAITFVVAGFLSTVPMMVVTGRTDYDEYP